MNALSDALTSASMNVVRDNSKPFNNTLALAFSKAGPDESIDVTWPAPPAKAATLKPPV